MKKTVMAALIALIAWSGLIYYFSSLSSVPLFDSVLAYWFPGILVDADSLIRKSAHVVEFAILTALLYFAWTLFGASRKRSLALAILCALIFAVSDEVHQLFVMGRSGCLSDVLIDSVGILAGVGTCYLCQSLMIFRRRRSIKKLMRRTSR